MRIAIQPVRARHSCRCSLLMEPAMSHIRPVIHDRKPDVLFAHQFRCIGSVRARGDSHHRALAIFADFHEMRSIGAA
jgi:hypothetical protein